MSGFALGLKLPQVLRPTSSNWSYQIMNNSQFSSVSRSRLGLRPQFSCIKHVYHKSWPPTFFDLPTPLNLCIFPQLRCSCVYGYPAKYLISCTIFQDWPPVVLKQKYFIVVINLLAYIEWFVCRIYSYMFLLWERSKISSLYVLVFVNMWPKFVCLFVKLYI